MVGYVLTFAVLTAVRSPELGPDGTVEEQASGMSTVMVFLAHTAIVGTMVGSGAVLAVGRAGLGRLTAAVVAALGPLALIATGMLLLYFRSGITLEVMLWDSAAAIAGTALGIYLGAARRRP